MLVMREPIFPAHACTCRAGSEVCVQKLVNVSLVLVRSFEVIAAPPLSAGCVCLQPSCNSFKSVGC